MRTPFSTLRTEPRMGYFEITYCDRQRTQSSLYCLAASGFVAAKREFDRTDIGDFVYIREIPASLYTAWLNNVSSAKTQCLVGGIQ